MTLRSRFEMPPLAREEWRHIFWGNPLLKRLERDWTGGWVAERDGEEIVGYLGNLPLSYEMGTSRLVAAAMSSWVVDSRYRQTSLLLLREFLDQAGVDLLLNTTANSLSSRALEALRIHRVPVDGCDICRYWITNARGFAASAFRKRRWPLANVASLPVGVALAVLDRFRSRGRGRVDEDHVREVHAFDARFDALWAERGDRESLRASRDSETLDWVFEYPRRLGNVWTLAVEDDVRLMGYGIFLRRDRPAIRLRRVRLVDLRIAADDRQSAAAILGAALKKCRREDIHVLEVVGFGPAKRDLLDLLAPRRRTLEAWPFYYKAKSTGVMEALERPEVWDPCLLDGDGCF